jgi:signal transduction histidine kinase
LTLRLRLFALFLTLAAVLAVGEWVLVRALSADLERELATAAASVGEDVLRALRGELPGEPPVGKSQPGAPGAKTRATMDKQVFVVRGEAGAPKADAQPGASPEHRLDDVMADLRALPDPHVSPTGGPTEIARGVIEVRHVQPDGSVLTERRHVEARLEHGKEAHVVFFRGDHAQQLPVPTTGVRDAVQRFASRLLLASLGLFGGALLFGVVVTHRFTRPLRDLAVAARRVGEGDLGTTAPPAPGEVGEAVTAFNQMSERLRALDEEARRLRASQQLSELGEVGRGLAHSLRNPLNALGLAIDDLAQAAAGGERSGTDDPLALATAARRQIRRIDDALRGFLALSTDAASAAPVDLVAVARDVALEALQTRPAGDGAPRVEVIAPDGPLRLVGVEAELRAALQALVVNAIEASPAGAPVVVRVETAPGDPPSATITVDDNGPGLPAVVRERLFTPHVTTKPAGAGMGLYLAHRIATTRYGGALTIENRDGGGSRATLVLRARGDGASA